MKKLIKKMSYKYLIGPGVPRAKFNWKPWKYIEFQENFPQIFIALSS